MKRVKRRKRARADVGKAFVRGVVATALLAGLEGLPDGRRGLSRNGMRRAIKGGVAVAAGTAVAESLQERDYSGTVLALVAGAAGIVLTDRHLGPDQAREQDQDIGKEQEIQEI